MSHSATSMNGQPPQLPWYRHRWPWLLMAGPALVVVASLVTLWLAIRSGDGLVTDDYYKQGLAINRTLARNERAQALGLTAALSMQADRISVRLDATAPGFTPPPRVRLTISHPTRAGLDQSQLLPLAEGRYSGRFALPEAGHWVVLLEDAAGAWRMTGNVVLPAAGETLIGASPAAGPRDPSPPQ